MLRGTIEYKDDKGFDEKITTNNIQVETNPIITGPSGLPGAKSSTQNIEEESKLDIFQFKADEVVTWSIDGGMIALF